MLLADPNDVAGIDRLFSEHKDIAAVILEPTGASCGKMPIVPAFLQQLRDLTKQAGTMLIFDEVVTGFRVSPGGRRRSIGVTPDMTTLAKILAGGLPGGAVVGRKDILDLLDFQVTKAHGQGEDRPSRHLQRQPGVGGGRHRDVGDPVDDRCLRPGQRIRRGHCARKMNEVLEEEHVKWAVHGSYSGMHIFTNPDGDDIVPSQLRRGAVHAAR